MNIHDLLSECIRSGIRLAENNGDLRVHFDGPAPDRALLDLLRQHKQDILKQLANSEIRHVAGIPVLPPRTRTSVPASTAQRRMWLLHMLDEANGAYNMVGVYRVHGSFDVACMRTALDTLVARHEALRTVFAEEDGELRQCVQSIGHVAFEHIDLSTLASEEAERALQRVLQRENHWRFDLAAGPLLRATCSELGGGNWMLLLNIHHIAGDEWSIGILEREISALYAALFAGTPSTLPAPILHYVDYAAWSSQQAEGIEQLAQLDYWKAKLADLPALHSLPLDKPRPAVQAYDGATVRRILPPRWLQSAQTLCQANNATLFMYLHAALATVLSVYSNEDDIALGFPVSGRQRKELETVVGLFVNTLILRVPVRGNVTFADALALSREAVIEALQHRDVPFDILVDALCSGRSPAYTPLVQIFLALQAQERAGLCLPGADVEALDNAGAPVKFDLQVDAVASEAGLVVDWRFNRSLFEDASMERMADALVRVLEASVHAPDQPLSRIDLLAP
uniref:condensation domain-containing protein n=1 Tax=Xanthomonas sp. SHU 199 TaxID=1591174 RepID=UPI001E3456D2